MPEEPADDFDEVTECPPDCVAFTKCIFCSKRLTTDPKETLGSRLLVCCHAICSSCADGWDNEETKSCPVCSVSLPKQLLDNKILQEMVEEPLSDTVKKGLCGTHPTTPANKWCKECNSLACEGCIENHKNLMSTRSHTIVDVKDVVPTTDISLVNFACHQHPSCQLDIFCTTCNHLTCRDCQLEKHKRHTHNFVSGMSMDYKRELFDKRSAMWITERTLGSSKRVFELLKSDLRRQKTEISEKIEEIFKKIQETIRSRITELKNQLDLSIDKELDILDKGMDAIDQVLMPLKHSIDVVNIFLLQASDMTVVYSKDHLEECLKLLIKKEINLPNSEVKKLFSFCPIGNFGILLNTIRSLGIIRQEDRFDGSDAMYEQVFESESNAVGLPGRIHLRRDLQQLSPESKTSTRRHSTSSDAGPTVQVANMPNWHTPQEAPSPTSSLTITPIANSAILKPQNTISVRVPSSNSNLNVSPQIGTRQNWHIPQEPPTPTSAASSTPAQVENNAIFNPPNTAVSVSNGAVDNSQVYLNTATLHSAPSSMQHAAALHSAPSSMQHATALHSAPGTMQHAAALHAAPNSMQHAPALHPSPSSMHNYTLNQMQIQPINQRAAAPLSELRFRIDGNTTNPSPQHQVVLQPDQYQISRVQNAPPPPPPPYQYNIAQSVPPSRGAKGGAGVSKRKPSDSSRANQLPYYMNNHNIPITSLSYQQQQSLQQAQQQMVDPMQIFRSYLPGSTHTPYSSM